MATADRLVELMYSWMESRRKCARELRDLAGELESLREKCNAGETVGNSIAVLGAGCMVGAGLLTFATGGIAAPFLGALGAAYSTVGATITVATKIIEGFKSSGTMERAQNADQFANTIAKEIDQLFEKLKAEGPGGSEQDHHIVKEVLEALSRRCGLSVSDMDMDLLLNERLFSYKPGHTVIPETAFESAMKDGIVGIFSVFAFSVEDKVLTKLLTKGTEEIVKKMAANGLKTALKGGARVLGGVLGLAFSLPDAINNWEAQIKNNHVTDASQSLRHTSKAILEVVDDLQEKLDSICKEFEELKEVKECIENRDRYSRRALLRYAMKYCQDPEVKTWLEDEAKTKVFLRLVDVFQMVKTELDKERKKKKRVREIEITFVAHGGIPESMISASLLMPLPTILDVVLYSPWNSTIDAKVAYGIAAGTIEPKYRKFCCERSCHFPSGTHNHTPSPLPAGWNRMRAAQGQTIPNIKVKSMVAPKDGAWNEFVYLKDALGLPDYDRVVIPFILPRNMVIEVPFAVVTLALALVLLFSQMRARVHLAACLSKVSADTNLQDWYLRQQYAYTVDHTRMSTTDHVYPTTGNFQLFQNFRDMFG